jgi:hypothetical protein
MKYLHSQYISEKLTHSAENDKINHILKDVFAASSFSDKIGLHGILEG